MCCLINLPSFQSKSLSNRLSGKSARERKTRGMVERRGGRVEFQLGQRE